jgi:YARHG domain
VVARSSEGLNLSAPQPSVDLNHFPVTDDLPRARVENTLSTSLNRNHILGKTMDRNILARLIGAAASVFVGLVAPAHAGDIQGDAYSCQELWGMRNDIYKEGGYCFKTSKAISQFGNAGCQYDDLGDVRLSANQRTMIRDIKKSEARLGC